ncbi:MAG: septal ring lytic transglycosylase RlpA family protein [Comamonadaceae bacterium]|nr:MAG: septal ring lytic transglycosylase RlpA family protein [Comamonadaceae bacterium]
MGLGCCCWLAACTTPPPADVDGAASAPGAAAAPRARLSPLARGLAVPAGAAPRSLVPAVNYELTSIGDLPPDDGVPGDEGPRDVFERGGASWYGIQFHQRKTANGERFDMSAFTAAHKTLPFNTRVCVRSLVNGKEVLVRINDRGPYAQGRVIDLSRAAADQIGLTSMGIKQVALSVIDRKDQRCGGVASNLDDAPAAAEPVAKPTVKSSVRRAAPRKSAAPRRR